MQELELTPTANAFVSIAFARVLHRVIVIEKIRYCHSNVERFKLLFDADVGTSLPTRVVTGACTAKAKNRRRKCIGAQID